MDKDSTFILGYSVMNQGQLIREYPIVETEKELYEDLLDLLVHTRYIEVSILSNGQRIGNIEARCQSGRNAILAEYLSKLLVWSGVGLVEDWQDDMFYYENLPALNSNHKGEIQGRLKLTIHLREKRDVKNQII